MKGCQAFGITNPGGAVAGNGRQIGLQIVGALFIIGWNVAWTSLIMIFIKYVCRVDLRMSPEELEEGDYAIHGEEPYTFEYYNRNFKGLHAGYVHDTKNIRDVEHAGSSGGSGQGDVILGHDPEHGEKGVSKDVKGE